MGWKIKLFSYQISTSATHFLICPLNQRIIVYIQQLLFYSTLLSSYTVKKIQRKGSLHEYVEHLVRISTFAIDVLPKCNS